MSGACFLLALVFFGVAAFLDRPWHPITPRERLRGNFCCSAGFFFLTAALMLASLPPK